MNDLYPAWLYFSGIFDLVTNDLRWYTKLMELRDRGIEWVGSVEVGNYGGISEIDIGD